MRVSSSMLRSAIQWYCACRRVYSERQVSGPCHRLCASSAVYFSVYVSSCCHIVAELLFKSVGVLSCWGGGVSELGGAGSRALEPRGRGGAGRVVSREAECSSGPDVRNSLQGAGTRVVQGSTVTPGTSSSSLGASGVYSMCLCGCVRRWCPASSRVCVFA